MEKERKRERKRVPTEGAIRWRRKDGTRVRTTHRSHNQEAAQRVKTHVVDATLRRLPGGCDAACAAAPPARGLYAGISGSLNTSEKARRRWSVGTLARSARASNSENQPERCVSTPRTTGNPEHPTEINNKI